MAYLDVVIPLEIFLKLYLVVIVSFVIFPNAILRSYYPFRNFSKGIFIDKCQELLILIELILIELILIELILIDFDRKNLLN